LVSSPEVSGEILQHGPVTVQENLEGKKCPGLTHFDFGKEEGQFTLKEITESCRMQCYADIECVVWQLVHSDCHLGVPSGPCFVDPDLASGPSEAPGTGELVGHECAATEAPFGESGSASGSTCEIKPHISPDVRVYTAFCPSDVEVASISLAVSDDCADGKIMYDASGVEKIDPADVTPGTKMYDANGNDVGTAGVGGIVLDANGTPIPGVKSK
jgi:hypothetical protein